MRPLSALMSLVRTCSRASRRGRAWRASTRACDWIDGERLRRCEHGSARSAPACERQRGEQQSGRRARRRSVVAPASGGLVLHISLSGAYGVSCRARAERVALRRAIRRLAPRAPRPRSQLSGWFPRSPAGRPARAEDSAACRRRSHLPRSDLPAKAAELYQPGRGRGRSPSRRRGATRLHAGLRRAS